MKKKMAVALIAAMIVTAVAGTAVAQAVPKEKKESETKVEYTDADADIDVVSLDILNKDIYYMGAGENEETVVLGASEDWSDYEAIVTVAGRMAIISSGDLDVQEGKEIIDETESVSVNVAEDRESVTITLTDGRTLKAERSELVKSAIEMMGVINTFDSAIKRGELDVE